MSPQPEELEAHQATAERLKTYEDLLERYKLTLNLVSPSQPDLVPRLVTRSQHYATELEAATAPHDTIVDVGSGAGIPGIVVSLLLPDRYVILVERRRRRSAFLDLAVGALELKNAVVVQADVRDVDHPPVQAFSAQSVMPLRDLYCTTRHLHDTSVTLVSVQGDRAEDDIAELGTEIGTAALQPRIRVLEDRGTLIALRLPGGRTCRSSALSIRKGA